MPAKTQLTGDVEVAGSAWGYYYDDYYYDDYSDAVTHAGRAPALVPGVPTIPPSESLTDLIADVNAWPVNDTLDVAFTADVNNSNTVPIGPDGMPANVHTSSTTLTDAIGPLYAEGDLDKYTSDMMLIPMSRVVVRGHSVKLFGMLDAEEVRTAPISFYPGQRCAPARGLRIPETTLVSCSREGLWLRTNVNDFSQRRTLYGQTEVLAIVFWGWEDSPVGQRQRGIS